MPAAFDVVIQGDALNDRGFVNASAVSGIGLNTFGFLWDCGGIWGPGPFVDWFSGQDPAITTAWADSDAALTTTWTDCDTVITTTWTDIDGVC